MSRAAFFVFRLFWTVHEFFQRRPTMSCEIRRGSKPGGPTTGSLLALDSTYLRSPNTSRFRRERLKAIMAETAADIYLDLRRSFVITVFTFAALFSTSACTRVVGEEDVFLPQDAQGTLISIEDENGFVFEENRARDGLFNGMNLSVQPGFLKTRIGQINYRLVRQTSADKPLIVYCGGNSYDLPSHGELVTWKTAPHGDLLLWDYPGYGVSEGQPTVEHIRSAAEDVAQAISSFRRSEEQPVIFWGHSLGGFICSELARHYSGTEAIIYEASAPSSRSAIEAAVPWYLKLAVRAKLSPELIEFESPSALPEGPIDVLVLGASKDQILPVRLSRKLRDELVASGHIVDYHEFQNANHFSIGFDDNLDKVISDFLRNTCLGAE